MTEASLHRSTSNPTRLHAALLACILIFAGAVRIHGLTRLSFWFDECATIEIVQTPWAKLIHKVISTENTPPAYYCFVKIWGDLFGVSEWSMRLPSALAGIASVWLLYRLCSYTVGKTQGLIAAALLSVSHYHIWYSQEARVYVFMLLLALWSCDEFVRMLDAPPSWKRDFRYWLATVLLLYSHLYAALAIAAQLIYYAAGRISGKPTTLSVGRLLQIEMATWIPFAMWVPVLMQWYRTRSAGFWIPPVSVNDITVSYWSYVADQNRLAFVAFVVLVVLGATKRKMREPLVLMLSLMLLPVILPVIASMLSHPLYLPRYGMIGMAGLFMLAACGVARLPRLLQPVVVVLLAIPMLFAPDPMIKGSFREAGNYLKRWVQPIDYVEVNCRADLAPVRYYMARNDVVRRGFWGYSIPLGLPLFEPDMHVWLVISASIPPQSGVMTILRGNWTVVSQKHFGEITIFELANGVTEESAAPAEEIRYHSGAPSTTRRWND